MPRSLTRRRHQGATNLVGLQGDATAEVTLRRSGQIQGATKEELPRPRSYHEAALAETETIRESGKIFVRNLSYSTTEEDIGALFVKFGPRTKTSLPIYRLTRKQKGFAFVTFMMPEHAAPPSPP